MRLKSILLAATLVILEGAALGGIAHAQAPAPAAAPAAAATDAANTAWLANNAKQAGIKVLPSGLQYKVVTAGPAGPSPKEGDVIKIHYEGSLTSGAVFDSSFQRGQAALMPLGGLVPAWMEAVPLMHVGDEWVIYAPPELGYGAEGGGPIPPNSILIFRMKLLGMLSAD